jgi:hypothetical protein
MKRLSPGKPFGWSARLLVAGAVLLGVTPAAAVDQFSPSVVTLTLGAGESATVDKMLHLDALPEFADIVVAIDTTGSMGLAIAQAKNEAVQICNNVKAQIPGARFAAVDFEDYPLMPGGSPSDIAYALLTPGFVTDCTTFSAAINTMVADGGGDFAEAYSRTFFEAFSDPALVYLPQAVRFLVVLGDAPPHDATQTAAPACGSWPPTDFGRNNVAGGGDDIETEAALAGLVANNITLLMIRYNNSIPLGCFQELAQTTGGQAVNAGGAGTLSNLIVQLVEEEAAEIDQVELVVSPGCPLAISFDPPPPYGPFTAPVDILFQETITAPTVPGGYMCTVTAVVDGAQRAVQAIDVTVTSGPAATLDLEPTVDTNPVDTEHCVTATVRDEFGNAVSGVVVRFSVTPPVGRSPASGSDVTGGSGQATFCYTSALLGSDVIHAYADLNENNVEDPGEPFDDAAKIWTPPVSTALCEVDVTYGGHITAANGDKGSFGGNAKVNEEGDPQGQEEYQDHGPVQPLNVHSINVLAVVCPDVEPPAASIHGEATIDGSGSFVYRIDVKDVNEPGKGFDTYRIRLSNGYDSEEKVLEGGNVQIHK